jgi:xylan 1,4-beta-xylosidase
LLSIEDIFIEFKKEENMNRFLTLLFMLISTSIFAQSASFKTYMNPVIPGDHPDCTITIIGNDFYTTGSSFNVTPTIYHSTDLVHWEAIARPVSASWLEFGDKPGGGCWGGQIVLYKGEYWDFFSKANTMYFVKASKPSGPWSEPVMIKNPSTINYGLGYDNSILIDDNNKWYLVIKNGRPNNGIVELGNDGQPTGLVYNLNWLNPDPSYPYSWAEGPVMWKDNEYYYYSFARDLAGGQKVMRSKKLTAEQNSWEMLGDFFNENDPQKETALFTNPNHASQAVKISDGTSWVLHPLYAKGEWKGQGRQGLLNQVRYDSQARPTADYPTNKFFNAPKLPSSGIPWMVPKSDFFSSAKLNPEWSFLGYTQKKKISLTERSGWLRISPKDSMKTNTLTKNDGEHNYSLITRMEFTAKTASDEAGLLILRGDEKMFVKLACSTTPEGKSGIFFSFENYKQFVENDGSEIIWLKIVRNNHKISGYFSGDGKNWKQVGEPVDISAIDSYSDFSSFTGTRQGLYVKGSKDALFDFYIYRDAYTPILAECPANQFGTLATKGKNEIGSLDDINNNDWALYAGVEFGNKEYKMKPSSITITASCESKGGVVEVWVDSLDSKNKIAECKISNSGGLDKYKEFSVPLLKTISGRHDVYLRFKGNDSEKLFSLQSFVFAGGNKKK